MFYLGFFFKDEYKELLLVNAQQHDSFFTRCEALETDMEQYSHLFLNAHRKHAMQHSADEYE